MSVVATFTDGDTTHLISDSLVSIKLPRTANTSDEKWLSTGVYIDVKDQSEYVYQEGALKIWVVQPNLAIGYAGNIGVASYVLEKLANRCKSKQITAIQELEECLARYYRNRAIRDSDRVDLCGFLSIEKIATKFRLCLAANSSHGIQSTTNPKVTYAVGSGRADFLGIWKRIPRLYQLQTNDPALTFGVIANHLYLRQFLDDKSMFTRSHIGGAISGVYLDPPGIEWQPSSSITVYFNVGGTGLDAQFAWHPKVFKIWQQRGVVYSMSMFLQNDGFYNRITENGNALSNAVPIDPNNLPPEMRTYNASRTDVLLLPNGLSIEFPAVLSVGGEHKAYDELVEDNRVVGIRPNDGFVRSIGNRICVAPDHTLKILDERLPCLVNALKRRIQEMNQDINPLAFYQRKSELAVRLAELGGRTYNTDQLADALDNFLGAVGVAFENDLRQKEDAMHNLSEFVDQAKRNLTSSQYIELVAKKRDLLSRYGIHE